jgi:hypothetical protein
LTCPIVFPAAMEEINIINNNNNKHGLDHVADAKIKPILV